MTRRRPIRRDAPPARKRDFSHAVEVRITEPTAILDVLTLSNAVSGRADAEQILRAGNISRYFLPRTQGPRPPNFPRVSGGTGPELYEPLDENSIIYPGENSIILVGKSRFFRVP